MSTERARAALLITARVANFDRWYEAFNENEQTRRDHGISGHHVNRHRGDGHLVSVFLAVEDIEAARKFPQAKALEATMKKAGVEGSEFIWLKPRSENIVWNRELPAIIVRHEVKDFLQWKKFYDVAAAIRNKSGIVGDATNTLLDNERVVIIYHQAERFADLETFLADPELKETMQLAGVTSEPEVTFATGGWAKRYTSPELSPARPRKDDSTSTHV